jgi:hypothetical protein
VLLVRGARNVHALYLALLQQPWCGAADTPDVPLLLAPVPFWGASLTQLHLKVGHGRGTREGKVMPLNFVCTWTI